jgi:glycosyltransferase involved in cell wall biosynthesis
MARILSQAGAEIIDATDSRRFLQRTPGLLRHGLRLKADILLVGFPGHLDVAAAKAVALATGARLVFDPLVGLYETNVEDMGNAVPGSLGARRYALEDLISCRLADVVLLDTDAHISHFRELSRAGAEKFRRVWLGTDDTVMYPRSDGIDPASDVFLYGNMFPIHGFEHVLGAAQLLQRRNQHVTFTVVGGGERYRSLRQRAEDSGLASVRFMSAVPYERLAELMASSRVCLGIFGTSGQARRVIPNKVFDALAMAKPLITADTPAVREALTHGVHAWLCPPSDSEALADAIWRVVSDRDLQRSMAAEGRALFEREFSSRALSASVGKIFAELA